MAGNPFSAINDAMQQALDKNKANTPPVTHNTVAPGGAFNRTNPPLHRDDNVGVDENKRREEARRAAQKPASDSPSLRGSK